MKISETSRGLETSFILELPHGLHSRPSARLAQIARHFRSDILLVDEDGEANVKSMLDVLSLAPKKGDSITIVANGPDAEKALEAICNFFETQQD